MSTILDVNGRPYSSRYQAARIDPPRPIPEAAPTGRDAVQFSLVDRWATHPGYGLTPRRVLEIFREAEAGYPQRQCDLFEDVIENDGHLRSLVEGYIEDVAGKDWMVQAGGDGDADRAAAEALNEAMRLIPSVQDFFEHQLMGKFHGFSATEIIWERRDGLTVPAWLANVPHRRFIFGEDDEPALINSYTDWTKGAPLTPGKWVFSRGSGRLAVRAALMRTLTWWALFKRLAVRDWVVFAEKYGLPYVTGEYAESASDEDKKVLKEAVSSLGKDGAAVFSEACKIVIHEVQSGGKTNDVHGAIANMCNAEMSKLVAGATLNVETGTAGSYAQSRVHENRSFSRVLGAAKRLSEVFEQQVGLPFVRFNGMPAKPPRLKIHVVRDVDPETRAKVLSVLANELGLEIDEEQVRQEFQVKTPAGKALKGTKKPDPAAAPKPGEEDAP